MRVRLTRKLADVINGVDVSRARVGDVLDVPAHAAAILIAEQWAVPTDPSTGVTARPQRSRRNGTVPGG